MVRSLLSERYISNREHRNDPKLGVSVTDKITVPTQYDSKLKILYCVYPQQFAHRTLRDITADHTMGVKENYEPKKKHKVRLTAGGGMRYRYDLLCDFFSKSPLPSLSAGNVDV